MLKTVWSRHQIDTSWLKLTWEIAIPWSQSPTGNPALRAMISIQINWSVWQTWNTVQFLRQISIYCNDTDIVIAIIWFNLKNCIISFPFFIVISEKRVYFNWFILMDTHILAYYLLKLTYQWGRVKIHLLSHKQHRTSILCRYK